MPMEMDTSWPHDVGANSPLQLKAMSLVKIGIFLGGPVRVFHAVGCHQLVTLLERGLMPHHSVLDVGCGCLRGGYWLIHFLERGKYFGIEPNEKMLALGLNEIVPAHVLKDKEPRFSNNADFDFGVFGEKFDFVVARSIWTHAAPHHIIKMLDQFSLCSKPSSIFLASYGKANSPAEQYDGTSWVGKSHESSKGGFVRYSSDWIVEICRERKLEVRELPFNFRPQIWVRISHQQTADLPRQPSRAPTVLARPKGIRSTSAEWSREQTDRPPRREVITVQK